jgi:hypothetical protein
MNIKLLSLFSLLLLFLLASNILYSQEESKVKNFEDPKHRYKLTLPAGWDDYKENGEPVFTSLKGTKDFAACYVFGFPVESGMTLSEIAKWVMEGFDQNEEGHSFKVISEKKASVAAVEALLIKQEEKYKEGDQEKTIWIDEYFFIKNGQCFILHFDTTKDGYKAFNTDFDKIVSSFVAGDKPFDDIINSFKEEGTKTLTPVPVEKEKTQKEKPVKQ